MSVDAPASEQDFQPLCESSRLSIASPRLALVSPKAQTCSPLPPMSPRTPRTPEPASDISSPFFLERNIDQVWNFHTAKTFSFIFISSCFFSCQYLQLLARSLSETCQVREPQKLQ